MVAALAIVDAFTAEPFAGNPAAVCPLEAAPDERWMQRVAREMNLSETAFLVPRDGGFDLRWFTPRAEVDLCGHATLASAHVLWERGIAPPDAAIRFHTRSGVLAARRSGDWIEMDFPAEPAEPKPMPEVVAALGADPVWTGRNRMDVLVELRSEDEVRSLAPDLRALARREARGLIVTARASRPPFDVVSRFFAPRFGVDEDPVTGSAHCCLGPYWGPRLGKEDLLAFQASERGGVVRVVTRGARVGLYGQAVTVLDGRLLR